ncbi:NAD(P)/FAD-dependent oxidoreductase [Flavobacterium sp. XS2P39]|uniref:NAD(P)/FAD-dependent oxidoreductase n=1 Tax=Flavobacterium sp. XS2P39 TaxID=3401725 RepID=UPI003AAF4B4A
MPKHQNIIIIGFGSSACAAALNSLLLGRSVTILAGTKVKNDKQSEDRPSESIHPGLLSLLDHLNCGSMPVNCKRGVYENILANGENTMLGKDSSGVWEGVHIDKEIFLCFLRDKVVKGRVEIYYKNAAELLSNNGRIVGVTTDDGIEYFCDYVIDGSGRFHFSARELALKREYFSPPLVCWSGVTKDILPEIFEKINTSFTSNGWSWTWLAPENNGNCTWTRLSLKGQSDFKPPKLLEEFQNSTPIVFTMRWHLFRPVAVRGLLICGDAAGVIDPAAGQGIFYSMLSAIAAIETIDRCLKSPESENAFLMEYDHWFVSQYMTKVDRLRDYYNKSNLH